MLKILLKKILLGMFPYNFSIFGHKYFKQKLIIKFDFIGLLEGLEFHFRPV